MVAGRRTVIAAGTAEGQPDAALRNAQYARLVRLQRDGAASGQGAMEDRRRARRARMTGKNSRRGRVVKKRKSLQGSHDVLLKNRLKPGAEAAMIPLPAFAVQ